MVRVMLVAVALVVIGLCADATRAQGEALPAEAKALVAALDDPDEAVRGRAIHQLRLLARRVDVMGGQRLQRGAEFEPKVPGLVPVLIRASTDKAESNRLSALFALADTRDPAAVAAIRERLKDDSQRVRFTAGCFLTEFADASGLVELKQAIKRFRANPNEVTNEMDTERLLASLARITGKSFGEIPMNPMLMSDSHKAAQARARYMQLLETWDAWWDWMPPAK